jgi:hypothetical protein
VDKEILLRHLAGVENWAALGERQIAGQRTRIEELEPASRGERGEGAPSPLLRPINA